jgi:hypothetical protein
MNPEAIITTLLAAAAFLKKPVQDIAIQSIKDVYEAARYYLRKRFGEHSDAAKVLDLAAQKPESEMRKAVLVEETVAAGLHTDAELIRLATKLADLLPHASSASGQQVQVSGVRNHVCVAGRDVISTSRVVQRTVITPDERHVSAEQREQIKGVIAEIATRLAHEDGRPNFAAGHRMLQRRFGVPSYAMLPRERFDEALQFLKRQRAAFRANLRRRNPAGFATDLHRAIFARAGELGWSRHAVYAFAQEKLGLSSTVRSLRELGPQQLARLANAMRSSAMAAVSAG